MTRVQLWSCGGGRQSAGIAAMIAAGTIPAPDHVAMVALEWEIETVWPYVDRYLVPALERLGIVFSRVERAQYATREFFGGADGRSVLLPVFTDQAGGAAGKLPEFCSGEWKRDVVRRWAADQPAWKDRGVDNWIGISWEERHRRRAPRRQWLQPVYPLLDRAITVSTCLAAVRAIGWPEPPRSRCRHCPNQSDHEWLELSAEEFRAACALEDHIRGVDPHAYFHRSLIPLRHVTLDDTYDAGLFSGGCTSGTCY